MDDDSYHRDSNVSLGLYDESREDTVKRSPPTCKTDYAGGITLTLECKRFPHRQVFHQRQFGLVDD